MPEQTVSFTVPNDGRFSSGFISSSGSVDIQYTSYCPTCGSGEDGSAYIGFTITPTSFLFSTGWQAISNDLLYTDILLGALVVLFLVYILRSRPRSPAMPR